MVTQLIILEERKEKAIESLSVSFAKNKLPLEEFERLVEYINKTESERELIVVEKIVAEFGRERTEPFAEEDESHTAHAAHARHHYQRNNLTVFSSRTFTGPLKSETQFVSILGSGCIKIRKADLKKQQTVLNVVSILADCVIMVESGIRVINNAVPILGDSKISSKVDKEVEAGGPELIISGTALLGDISVRLLKE